MPAMESTRLRVTGLHCATSAPRWSDLAGLAAITWIVWYFWLYRQQTAMAVLVGGAQQVTE